MFYEKIDFIDPRSNLREGRCGSSSSLSIFFISSVDNGIHPREMYWAYFFLDS